MSDKREHFGRWLMTINHRAAETIRESWHRGESLTADAFFAGWQAAGAQTVAEPATEHAARTAEFWHAMRKGAQPAAEPAQDAIAAAVAAERKRCKNLVRRYMPAGWSAVYDAMADEGPNVGVEPVTPVQEE